MAAPLGFKTFTTGEVLTAADTNGYLMQGVLVFADAAARTTAITSPQEGQTSYLKDTDVIQVYSGSAWVTKSGSSPLTTKGDLYTYSTTDARLGVGANDTVLTADSTAATGLKWATPSSGGMTLLSTTTLSGTSTTISSISQDYTDLQVLLINVTASGNINLNVQWNGSTSLSIVAGYYNYSGGGGRYADGQLASGSVPNHNAILYMSNYSSTTLQKVGYGNDSMSTYPSPLGLHYASTSAISSITVTNPNGLSFSTGTVLIYGVK